MRTPNILVIRNDKLGDFMLAWPAISLLKKQYPDSTITALVPDYTRPIAEMCPWIDELLIDARQPNSISDILHLTKQLMRGKFNCSISLFSETRTSMALWLARVPKRYGPASKLAQMFLNRRLTQRRSKSLKPEYEYNLDLARYCITDNGEHPVAVQSTPYLVIDPQVTNRLKRQFIIDNNIENDCRVIIIHPGSGGSANNLSIDQYSALAKYVHECTKVFVIITAGPEEYAIASRLSDLMNDVNHTVYRSTQGLGKYTEFISISDMFISGSTGVLHLAGALDIPTAAFYTNRTSATSLRWQTLNRECNRLAFSPPESARAEDMASIDIQSAANTICNNLKQT